MYEPPDTGMGQSSSVILDQNTQIITTEARVKIVSNIAPLILPLVPLQMWTEMTKSKICPIAKRNTAAARYTMGRSASEEWFKRICLLTHWFPFSENSQNEHRFQDEEEEEEDEGRK